MVTDGTAEFQRLRLLIHNGRPAADNPPRNVPDALLVFCMDSRYKGFCADTMSFQ